MINSHPPALHVPVESVITHTHYGLVFLIAVPQKKKLKKEGERKGEKKHILNKKSYTVIEKWSFGHSTLRKFSICSPPVLVTWGGLQSLESVVFKPFKKIILCCVGTVLVVCIRSHPQQLHSAVLIRPGYNCPQHHCLGTVEFFFSFFEFVGGWFLLGYIHLLTGSNSIFSVIVFLERLFICGAMKPRLLTEI